MVENHDAWEAIMDSMMFDKGLLLFCYFLCISVDVVTLCIREDPVGVWNSSELGLSMLLQGN